MLLMIDNYDSFTYNLVQYLGELGADVRVFRNDQITLEEIDRLKPERLVISPGPCTPNEAGIVADLVPRREWDETMNKGRAIFRALAMAENGLNHLSN